MLSVSDYLAHLDADAHLLAAAAVRGPEARVPGCPGWSVNDLLAHVASVHARTSDIVEQGLADSWPDRAQLPEGMESIDWYRSQAARLSRNLTAVDPRTPAQAFAGPQTVEFWIRRMAHETAIHRVDAEQAHGYQSLLDPKLATDGVDEVFDVFATRIPAWADFVPSQDIVRIDTGGRSWTARFGRVVGERRNKRYDLLKVVLDPDEEPGATVAGEPDQVLLWMWGRAPVEDVIVAGDPRIVGLLREVSSI